VTWNDLFAHHFVDCPCFAWSAIMKTRRDVSFCSFLIAECTPVQILLYFNKGQEVQFVYLTFAQKFSSPTSKVLRIHMFAVPVRSTVSDTNTSRLPKCYLLHRGTPENLRSSTRFCTQRGSAGSRLGWLRSCSLPQLKLIYLFGMGLLFHFF